MRLIREAMAVAYRDIYLQGKLWKTILLSFLSIFIIIVLGSLIGSAVNGQSSHIFAAYFTGGIVGYWFITIGFTSAYGLILDKRGFYKLLLVAPVDRMSILIGKFFSSFFQILKFAVVFGIVIIWYFGNFTFSTIALFAISVLLILLTFVGIGFIVASFINNKRTATSSFDIINMIFLLLSGIFYPISSMPVYARILIYLNPATYALEAVRYSINGSSTIPIGIVFTVLLSLALFCSIFGVYFFDKKQRV